MNILDFFPLPKPRPQQITALKFIEAEILAGRKDIILSAPCGVGKSLIGVSTGLWMHHLPSTETHAGAYYLVQQKMLQDQLETDIERNLKPDKSTIASLKSSTEYPCVKYKNCALGRLSKKCTAFKTSECAYQNQKTKFTKSSVGITNYSYFLTERSHVKQLEPRKLLICDEAHGVEKSILNHVGISITKEMVEEYTPALTFPRLENLSQFFNWLSDKYIPVAEDHLKMVLDEANMSADSEVAKILNNLSQHVQKVKHSVISSKRDPRDWVFWETEKQEYIARPIHAHTFAHPMLLDACPIRLFMSAYPGEKKTFCNSLGINPDKAAWLELDSPFAPQNRAIFLTFAGSMSRKNQEVTLPRFLALVETIVNTHKDTKGVVHCLDDKTRVLTKTGFKGIDNLEVSDLIATLNPNSKALEFQPAISITKRNHTGKMVAVKTRGLDMLVTPEHRVWCIAGKNNNSNPSIIQAHTLVDGRKTHGLKTTRIFKIPKTIENYGGGNKISKAQARFLGWFCSEGCAFITHYKGKNDYKVNISQKNIEQTEIPRVIKSAGYHAWIQKCKTCDTAVITNKSLCLTLRETCYQGTPSCYTKCVPQIIKDADSDSIKQFLLSLVAGDGSVRKNPATRSEKPHMQLYTTSQKLCEDVVELALRCGWSANFTHVDETRWKPTLLNGRIVPKGKIFVIYIGSGTKTHQILPGDASYVNYTGRIYCPTTTNGIIFVERNGKTYWTGNCHSYALGRTIANHLRQTSSSSRILFPENASARESSVNYHVNSPEPTVLIGPAFGEGYDFSDDKARWQIIAKVPWGSIGDHQVKARMEESRIWYITEAVKSLIQSTGRATRTELDFSCNYILDSDFMGIYEKHPHLFPQWWKDSVIMP